MMRIALCVALAVGLAVGIADRAAGQTEPTPTSPFGDSDGNILTYSYKAEIATFCLFLAYTSNADNPRAQELLGLAYTYTSYALVRIDYLKIIADQPTDEEFLSRFQTGYTSLYQAALIVYASGLIDTGAFAAAAANVGQTPGWSADPGTSDPWAWFALWSLLYSAGCTQDIYNLFAASI